MVQNIISYTSCCRKPSHHQEGVSLPWMSRTLPVARGSTPLALRTLRPTARLTGPSLSVPQAWDSTSLVLSSSRRPSTSQLLMARRLLTSLMSRESCLVSRSTRYVVDSKPTRDMRCRFLETRFVGVVTSLFQDRKQQQTSEVMLNLRVLCHLLAPTTSRGAKVLMALLHVKQPTTRLVPASPSGEKCAPCCIGSYFLSLCTW